MAINYLTTCLAYIIFMLSSFDYLEAGYQSLTQNMVPKKSCSALLVDFRGDSDSANTVAYHKLSKFNQMFHDWTNDLWRYDERIKFAQEELVKLQNCLKITDFEERIKNCGPKTNDILKKEIDLLTQKIAKLTANKNRIVTIQKALLSPWSLSIAALWIGGMASMNSFIKNIPGYDTLTPEQQKEVWWNVYLSGESTIASVSGGEGRELKYRHKPKGHFFGY